MGFIEDNAPFNPTTCSNVAALALLVYDYLCTLDSEVRYVWTGPHPPLSTVLWVLNRYPPFIDSLIIIHTNFSVVSSEQCKSRFKVSSWILYMGILTSEIILYLKTWALWNRSRKLGIFLVCLALFAGVPAAVFLEITLNSAQYVPAPLHGCALTGGNPILFFAWVEIALAETTVAILTLVKGLQHLRQTQTGWVVQLYSDGLLFYVFVLMTTLVNIFLPIAAHGNYGNMFAPVQRVVHSVLSTRILLLILRQRSRRSPSPSSSMSIEIPRNNLQTGDTIQFTTFMIDGTTEDDSTEQFSHFRPFSEPTSHDTPRPAPHTQEGIPEEGSDEAIRETA